MGLSDREQDLLQALSGTTKSALSLIPGLGQAIAGYDAYVRSKFDRNVQKIIKYLNDKADDLSKLFKEEYMQSEEGKQFARKVFDCAFDEQLEDKQELFINALINGIRNQKIEQIEKLKFIDILRQLSRASLMILAKMHEMFLSQVRGPGRNYDSASAPPQFDPIKIAEDLGDDIYSPYLINSAINEMESQGLFSSVGEWKKDYSGRYIAGLQVISGSALIYTDFTARFVEFITEQK
jgi:hypothetical protein